MYVLMQSDEVVHTLPAWHPSKVHLAHKPNSHTLCKQSFWVVHESPLVQPLEHALHTLLTHKLLVQSVRLEQIVPTVQPFKGHVWHWPLVHVWLSMIIMFQSLWNTIQNSTRLASELRDTLSSNIKAN